MKPASPLVSPSQPAIADPEFAEHVLAGLSHPTQKWLSAQYFYDDVGSSLFEAITALPEYGLTRADARLIREHASRMLGTSQAPLRIIELGSGSGLKTRWLLEAAVGTLGAVRYTPIDVSAFALELCRGTLGSVPGVEISLEQASYLPGLRRALLDRRDGERVLLLFLGSTIGNFPLPDARQFLMEVRNLLRPEDSLLLGADLVKPVPRLIEAYDDPIGVTAAFNKNLLARINRELGGRFDLRAFAHEARFNAAESRVEMHLRSLRSQFVPITALKRSFSFLAGETIWTESSMKFTAQGIRDLAVSAGFQCAAQWIDDEWLFAESLLAA